jgi:hypothetical protein
MPAFDPRDRDEVGAARGNAGYGGGGRTGGMGGGGGVNSRTVNPRTTGTPVASGPFSAQNIAALANTLAPGGYARTALGIGPSFDTTMGSGTHYGYDGSNMAGTARMGAGVSSGTVDPMRQKILDQLIQMNPKWADVLRAHGQMPTPTAPQAPATAPQTPPGLAPQTVPAATLGGPVPGLADYKMNAPAYGYFGLPGQKRPTAASLGGY